MANQRSLDELIEQAEKVHMDEFGSPLYTYTSVKYAYGNNEKWDIFCLRHSNKFQQNFRKHISGQRSCKECVAEKKNKNSLYERTHKFITQAMAIHHKDGKPLYNYLKVKYESFHTNVIINCPIHGDFKKTPANHTNKHKSQGCSKCSGRYVRTKEEFISEAQKKHSNSEGNPLYDYSSINYQDTTKHISIFCEKHNKKFLQTPTKHLSGQKCPDCSIEIVTKKNTMTTEEYIKAAKKIHVNSKGQPKYDYSDVDYKNNYTNINIICEHHGPFSQSPSVHKDNQSGCPSCRSSKGEQIILHYLIDKKIKFEREFKFEDCIFKRPLPFDFRVEWMGRYLLIEYQGEMHFRSVKYSKDDEYSEIRFREICERDKIKKEYAQTKKIELIQLTYKQKTEHEIRVYLDNFFI